MDTTHAVPDGMIGIIVACTYNHNTRSSSQAT